jgi:hypothetical protein
MSRKFPVVLYCSKKGKKLLKYLIGQKIVRMFHYFVGDKKEYSEYLQNTLLHYSTRDHVFSMIEGPLLVEFDSGTEVSFFAEESMESIAFCLERNKKDKYMDLGIYCKPLDQQDRLFIDVNSDEYSNECMRNFLYKRIIDIKLYHKKTASQSGRIGDHLISFVFEDKKKMAIGYRLFRLPHPMAVISWDTIPSDVMDNLFEIPIFD